jgi:AhpD family alkylhydroperoxidase
MVVRVSAPKLNVHAVRSLLRVLVDRAALRTRVIDPKLRETIVLHVSSINSCAVCSSIHLRVAREKGLTEAEIAEAQREEIAGDERTRAALRFAEIRTYDQERDFPEDVATFERVFDAREQREVRAVVDSFTFNNRFNNTWESVIPGAARRRKRLGLAR